MKINELKLNKLARPRPRARPTESIFDTSKLLKVQSTCV